MSTVRTSARSRTAAAVAACLVGASAGLIATAAPASAANTGYATYTCDSGTTASTTWARSTAGRLRITTTATSPVPIGAGDLSTVVGGVTLTSTISSGPLMLIAAVTSAPLSAPPTVLVVHYGGPYGPPADVTCLLVSGTTGGNWPV